MLTQEQHDAIDKIFADNFDPKAFMTPELIPSQKWVQADGRGGTVIVPMDCWEAGRNDDGEPDNSEDVSDESQFLKAGEYDVEIFEAYGARLSASGYLDCTDWVTDADPVKAAQSLADMFGEPQEEGDDD